MKQTISDILVADEVWVALAELHRRYPERESFHSSEIKEQVRREAAFPEIRPGISIHIASHCVANVSPNPSRLRMLYRLADKSYRLYRSGDPAHAQRTGKMYPNRKDLPEQYHHLLDWYEQQYCVRSISRPAFEDDPFLKLAGSGRELWGGIDVDAYIDALRSDEPERPVDETRFKQIWDRLRVREGIVVSTVTGLPFTYKLEGDSGLWFYREKRRIDFKLYKSDLRRAVGRLPLGEMRDVRDIRHPSYVYGILTDSRIVGN